MACNNAVSHYSISPSMLMVHVNAAFGILGGFVCGFAILGIAHSPLGNHNVSASFDGLRHYEAFDGDIFGELLLIFQLHHRLPVRCHHT
jgi:hypothetical protein